MFMFKIHYIVLILFKSINKYIIVRLAINKKLKNKPSTCMLTKCNVICHFPDAVLNTNMNR